MISEKTIQEVRDAADIVEVVSSHVKVEKAGIHLKACCPFHHEKTPSFVIYPKSNSYHCFGCHASGDSITFLMKQGNLTFVEAVRKLAGQFRIGITESVQNEDPQHDKKVELRALLLTAQQLFQQGGEKNPGVEYFKGRGFDLETITAFGIGYCSGSEKIEGDTEGAGLTNEKGNHRLWKRVTFPIKDHIGNIAAYAGRTLDANQEPKYLNFAETILYKKQEILYNLHFARPDIKQRKEVWIVEGYADVMAMYQAGHKNVVAICGTALTDGQCEQLRRVLPKKSRIYLALDNDKAGKKATEDSFPKLLPLGEVLIVEIEGAKDLGELAIAKPSEIETLKHKAHDALLLTSKEKMEKTENSPYAVSVTQDEVAALVAKVEDEDVRNLYVKEISSHIHLKTKELSDKIDKIRNPNTTKKKEEIAESEYVKVGDAYLQKILDFDPTTSLYTTRYKERKRGELELERNKAFVKSIPRFDDWVTMPAHTDYQRVIEHKHGGIVNRKLNEYQPLPLQPKAFDLPQGWKDDPKFDYENIPEIKYTANFFKHIANHKKYKARYLTLLWDYFAIMYLHPLQNLQALCLVSTEEGTGKSTLISYFVAVFGQNATTITPDRITANFNSQMSGKLFVAVEETSDQRAALENQLKDLITGREIIVERKFQESRREINFLKFIFASNHPEQFLKVGSATTRFAVLHVPQVTTKVTDILDKMIAEIPYALHFLKERGVRTPKTDRLWFDPTLWENEALLRLRQASKDVVVQNLELLIENIYLKCAYPLPYIRLSSEYLKDLMVRFAGESFKQKSPNYFSDVVRNKLQCRQNDTPSPYNYPSIPNIFYTEKWEYSMEKGKGRYLELPAYKFVSQQTIIENYSEKELNDFVADYKNRLKELEKEWGEDAVNWYNVLIEKIKTIERANELPDSDDLPDWVKEP
jgi:DNA primase